MIKKLLLSILAAMMLVGLTAVPAQAATLSANRLTSLPPETPPPGWLADHPIIVLPPNSKSVPFTPAQIRKAYGIDQLGATGAGKTIAIVDAYSSPTIQADLNTFNSHYGLPALNLTIAQPGGPAPFNAGWAMEISLDVEWAHAIAPGANILLVEAVDATFNSLLTAIDYANNHGADVVSMSWGGSEWSSEASYDSYFSHAGTTYFASSGDSGYLTNGALGVSWPAASSHVVSVGGTTLTINTDGTYVSETAWTGSGTAGGTGGGVSAYVTEPGFQSSYPIPSTGGKRGVPDVAFDADPNSGVVVYYNGTPYQVGGTSLSAPCWAALYTLGNQSGVSWVYSQASSNYAANFHDITSGNNGFYSAGVGYDLVTGLGSPKAAIIANSTIVTITASPTTIGSPVNLTITESNLSPAPLTSPYVVVTGGLTVTLTRLSASFVVNSDPDSDGVLDVGETWKWILAGVVVNANTTFTATGHGLDPSLTDITYPAYPLERATIVMVPIAGGSFTSFSTSDGTFEYVNAVASGGGPNQPTGFSFPFGKFSFKITGLTAGQIVYVTITLPTPPSLPANAKYLKPKPSDPSQWDMIPMENFGNNVIRIKLINGGLGDSDTSPSTITDPGGPAVPIPSPEVPGTSFWGNMALAALLGSAVIWVIRRRQIGSGTH